MMSHLEIEEALFALGKQKIPPQKLAEIGQRYGGKKAKRLASAIHAKCHRKAQTSPSIKVSDGLRFK